MADEPQWSYQGTALPAEADGRTCILCGQLIVDESQPGRWERKVEDDHADVEFVIEDGYSHYACTQRHQAERRRDRFQLPPVPDLPRRR